MFCPRLDHNIRLTADGQLSVCGHMVNSPGFFSEADLKSSNWLSKIKTQFQNNVWPDECIRCKEVEEQGLESVRDQSITAHLQYESENPEYMFVTGVLDNVCNAACIMCGNKNSTYIGKLFNQVVIVDNQQIYDTINKSNLLVFEITGGEPSVSNAYKKTLSELPDSVKHVRINTNCGKYIEEIDALLSKGIDVTITMSIDGVGKVFDYVRWPLKWTNIVGVINRYKQTRKEFSNLSLNIWSTISALNVGDYTNIVNFSKEQDIPMSFGLVHYPNALSIKFKNKLTSLVTTDFPMFELVGVEVNNDHELSRFLDVHDTIRKIDRANFI
jgi:sulfatase maturation enzyme AslB (radical SAM superfamily)